MLYRNLRFNALLLWILLAYSGIMPTLQCQTIGLGNPSFEDIPQHSKPPVGWFYCGQVGESPPDVHPTGMFNVQQSAFEGYTYVGMVTRDNNTWEGLGQRLESPIQAGQCYQFSLYACRSTTYASYSKLTGQAAEFTEPIIIRLWGGQHNCERKVLLASSKKVVAPSWTRFDFQFQAEQNLTHFFLEAYYNQEVNDRAYNGNVLVDNASPILAINCETGGLLSAIDTIQEVLINQTISKSELELVLKSEGPYIQFDQYDELEKQLIFINGNAYRYTNKALWKIAEHLRQRPKSKLLIIVKGDNPYAIIQRTGNIEELFEFHGINPTSYKIKPFKSKHLKKTWLWPSENTPILMNLMR